MLSRLQRTSVVLALAMVAAAFAACGDEETVASTPITAAGGSPASAGTSSMTSAGAAGSAVLGAGSGGVGGAASVPLAWNECQAGDRAFVERAFRAVLGRRPRGQGELTTYVALIATVDGVSGVDPAAKIVPGADLTPGRRAVLDVLFANPTYIARWSAFYLDALRVARVEDEANPGCFDGRYRPDDPGLARYVRDAAPTEMGDGKGIFTMRDLLASSLVADDVSPVYVANLFPMVALTFTGANAAPDALELARRADFGATFDQAYLHRDAVCLRCHNSEASVTFSPDPATNRFYPLPGHFEKALFGASTGPIAERDEDPVARVHAMLRYDGFVDGEYQPWGLSQTCGLFRTAAEIPTDVANIDAEFGAISGLRSSPWDLAPMLQRGFAKLRAHDLTIDGNGDVPDADEAFAYLVAMNIAEHVWIEVMGTPLTIANYFPRNQASRDELLALTEAFVSSGFSQQALLRAIASSQYFNLLGPDVGCGASAYAAPAIFDPWVIADTDPTRHGNGPADDVAAVTTRTLYQSTFDTMRWDVSSTFAFPNRESDEGDLEAELGVFLKDGEPGFRGFDFQARLSWEALTGPCQPPTRTTKPDYVGELLARGAATDGATIGDLVATLKDQLIGEPDVSPAEAVAIEETLGASLDQGAGSVDVAAFRRVCGAILSSPQYLLSGLTAKDTKTTPKLTAPAHAAAAICAHLEKSPPTGFSIACAEGVPVATKR